MFPQLFSDYLELSFFFLLEIEFMFVESAKLWTGLTRIWCQTKKVGKHCFASELLPYILQGLDFQQQQTLIAINDVFQCHIFRLIRVMKY